MANDGKKSEEIVRVILKSYQEKHPAFFTRLYDATTARGAYVPPQVADFLGVFDGTPLAIEVKSSEKHTSLGSVPKTYIQPSQVAGGRIFVRAGGKGLFIFHSLKDDFYELWDTSDVISWVLSGRRLESDQRLLRVKGKTALKIKLLEKIKCQK